VVKYWYGVEGWGYDRRVQHIQGCSSCIEDREIDHDGYMKGTTAGKISKEVGMGCTTKLKCWGNDRRDFCY
jgi:hypothetical protein